jgi:periplasmic divalent cation tolerance protein
MFYIVFSTASDKDEANSLVERLVGEKLVACANVIDGVSSTYWWRGKIERASEVIIVMKTSREKLDRLIDRIRELHSYEVPEIIAVPIERGLPEYLGWIRGSLGERA